MRSELVYAAGLRIENRFLLASAAMGAVHKLHVSSMRTEDTINKVFVQVAESAQFVAKMPEIEPPPAIDALLITSAA
jgi:hypothetical protein